MCASLRMKCWGFQRLVEYVDGLSETQKFCKQSAQLIVGDER
jgi:hypothetical protein